MIRRISAAALVSLGLAACAGGPPTAFYTLDPVAPGTAPAAAMAVGAPLVVTVALPEILDRAQLVRRSGPDQLSIAASDRWAAPLDDLVRRALAKDLALRLPGRLVTVDRPEGMAEPAVLRLGIEEFTADGGGRVRLEGHWTVTGGDGTVSPAEPVAIEAAATDGSAAAAVQAMSTALATLADQIAAKGAR